LLQGCDEQQVADRDEVKARIRMIAAVIQPPA